MNKCLEKHQRWHQITCTEPDGTPNAFICKMCLWHVQKRQNPVHGRQDTWQIVQYWD